MRSTLIFDGDCGFCTTSAGWTERHLGGAITIRPYQSIDDQTLGDHHIRRSDAAKAVYFVDRRGVPHRGHAAIAAVLRRGNPADRAIGVLLTVPPISWVAALAYRAVSRYRHRLPGGTPACKL